MNNKIERYTWEDLLVKAQAVGVISNGPLLAALKLSSMINWAPTDGRVPGLYWKNDNAFKAAGLGRSTFYGRSKDDTNSPSKVLFELGFFAHDNRQNIVPTLPSESLIETILTKHDELQSSMKTDKVFNVDSNSLQCGLEESSSDKPFSVDNSVKILSEDNTVHSVADAPSAGAEKSIYSKYIEHEKLDIISSTLLEIDNLLPLLKEYSLSSSSSALFTDNAAKVFNVDSGEPRRMTREEIAIKKGYALIT